MDDDDVPFALPQLLKTTLKGEFVFDWVMGGRSSVTAWIIFLERIWAIPFLPG